MPVGFGHSDHTCATCGKENRVIETKFYVCQHCQAVQTDAVRKDVEKFVEWLTNPPDSESVRWAELFNKGNVLMSNPLSLLNLHIRCGGSRHRFDATNTEKSQQRWYMELHPSEEAWKEKK